MLEIGVVLGELYWVVFEERGVDYGVIEFEERVLMCDLWVVIGEILWVLYSGCGYVGGL